MKGCIQKKSCSGAEGFLLSRRETGDLRGAVGVIFIAAGVGLAIPGVIISTKGAKRLKQYKEENNLTFDIRGTSGVLTYRF